MKIIANASLSHYTTYRIGGMCARMIFPETQDDFLSLREAVGELPVFVFGGGANVLFADTHFEAAFINLTKWQGITEIRQNGVRALEVQSGTALSDFVDYVRRYEIANYDYLAGIPGTIGGAVYMNAGAWRRYIEAHILEARLYRLGEGCFVELKREQMPFAYRKQQFIQPGDIVVSVVLDARDKDPQIGAKMDEVISLRCTKHPKEPSCGSVFKNPPAKPAGQLIESCGLKGMQIGQAQISPKHANFIVNLGGATFEDVRSLIELVQHKVRVEHGIALEPEVRIIESVEHPLFIRLA